jgi:two-component system phosphate regulon sensor histidine kinase PhoR
MRGLGRRIALTAMAATVIALLAVFLLVGPRLRARALEEAERTLSAEAQLTAVVVEAPLARGEGPEALDPLVDATASKVHSRITLIAPDGRVLADSSVALADLARVENHGTRPEVKLALAAGQGVDTRHSATVGQDFLYVALPVRAAGRLLGVVRVARSLADVDAEAHGFTAAVGTALLAAFAITALLSTLLASRLAGPLDSMMKAARRFAAGDLSVRIPAPRADELGELARILNQAVSQLQGRLADADRDSGRIQAILAAMDEGVLAVDHKGTVLLANPSLERSLGVSDAPGRHYLEVVRQRAVTRVIEEVLDTASRCEAEVEVHHVDRSYLVAGVPFPAAAGSLPGAVLTFHDVTARKRLDQMRRDFVANASHELRTPLTSIRGFVEALEDGAFSEPEPGRRFLEKIRAHADQMAALISDLLELSRIEAGEVPLNAEEVDLQVAVADAAAAFGEQAAQKGIALEARATGSPRVVTDPGLLRGILANLIDNAVKYTPAGGHLEVSAGAQQEGGALIQVRDDGPGIPPEDLPRIFERFYRVDRARSRELGGTGLGLSIVKHLAQTIGASVGVESAVGAGTCFSVRLPPQPPSRT